MYKITFLLRIHNDYHEHKAIDCTIKQLQATLVRLSKNRNVRDIYWEKTGQSDPKRDYTPADTQKVSLISHIHD
jgi:hypothetical protein